MPELCVAPKDLRGKTEFVTLEGQLRLSLEVADTKGHAQVETVAHHPIGTGATLRLGFGTDQTLLAPLIGQLAGIAAAFPVRGVPATISAFAGLLPSLPGGGLCLAGSPVMAC